MHDECGLGWPHPILVPVVPEGELNPEAGPAGHPQQLQS